MAPLVAGLFAREVQNCTFIEDGRVINDTCYVPFWATRTGVIVKWSIFLGIIVIVGLYLLLGHMHAQRRIRKGLPPLAYHRFLVSRATRAQVDPRYGYPQAATVRPYAPEGYGMYSMPPPVYDPNAPRPPQYEPPAGSTKVEANQQPGQQAEYTPPAGPPPSSAQAGDTYAPPSGPPPSAMRPQGTGNTNPFRD